MDWRRSPSPSTQNSPADNPPTSNPICSDDSPPSSVGSYSCPVSNPGVSNLTDSNAPITAGIDLHPTVENLMAEYRRYKVIWDCSRCSGDLTYQLTRMKTDIVTQCICFHLRSLVGQDKDSAFWNLLAFMEAAKFLRSRYGWMKIFILNKAENKFFLQEEEFLGALATLYGDGDGSEFDVIYTHTLSHTRSLGFALSRSKSSLLFNASQQPEPLLCMALNLSGIYIGRNDDACLLSRADVAEYRTFLEEADSVEFPAKRPTWNELWSSSNADPGLGSMVPLRRLRIWWSGEHSETIVI